MNDGSKVAGSFVSRLSEQKKIVLLVGGALLVGGCLQFVFEPGPKALVVCCAVASAATLGLSRLLPGRWREVMAGFRFTSVLLVALGASAVLGTLVLQGEPLEEYPLKYGALGNVILACRLDDIFHSLWFGCLVALFAAAVVNSALLRFPPKLSSLGFFTCHLGLITSLLGAGLSSYFAVRGRVEMLAGGSTVGEVILTRHGQPMVKDYGGSGRAVPVTAPLGFALRLDRFDLVRYATEYRVGYYEPRVLPGGEFEWRLKASFDPEPGVRHLLPGGDSFSVSKLIDAEENPQAAPLLRKGPAPGGASAAPAAVLEVRSRGLASSTPALPAQGGHNYVEVPPGAARPRGFLAFEKRPEEAKSFESHVTVLDGANLRSARISVNDPFTYRGWTFYQANYNPQNPRYSGLEAVHDPGVKFVFAGFALIIVGVFTMFYLENRLRRSRRAPSAQARMAA
ncbi:MAG TPA: cytochrome c biogenesis protein ResB [Anaeromyxobacteraceae bacterium]|nr:cytochrome c biogenesis protein ResB [Anaeromyxobacteraceae bacterium]